MKYLVVVLLCIAAVSAGGPAPVCDVNQCKIENNCRCSSTIGPLTNISDIPQLVSITFNEAIVKKYFDSVWCPLLDGRTNPDGSIISATFFVPHEYSEYDLVVELYNRGHEIGVHSVTKNHDQEYWRNAPYEELAAEFSDQREIINYFSRIPKKEIRGARAPQLQFNGNVTIQAYLNASLSYDNSWPTQPGIRLYPYTMDYATTEECEATRECPNESFPGFWVNPIIDITGKDGKYCHELLGCEIDGTAEQIADWLMQQVEASRSTNRAPVTFLADASWFDGLPNGFPGMKLFLDNLAQQKDIFLVSQYEIVQYMQNPVPLSQYTTGSHTRNLHCQVRKCINLPKPNGEQRNLNSCIPCPVNYPWLHNPHGL